MLVRRVSRLPELGRTGLSVADARLWGAVGLLFPQHPVRSLGQMAGDGNNGAPVALVWIEQPIEQGRCVLALCLDANGAVGGFDKGPLEIVVDVAAGAAVSNVSAAGDDARHEPGITGPVIGAREALNVADLQPNQRSKDRDER